ncbi:TIGR02588 family protein [Aliirhizobium smilacinae]|uniref:TIGR02588 family protein n=1 Tax=Aliirhizobium smilacinae TaxID=1395944 RepID=A0A5C4XKC1_9HYPH|nr:TIGR02588 family protein [Rhizobium smilacinae]TNM63080.1 TIGR02588 family protein [Rhizobium smilacinae]
MPSPSSIEDREAHWVEWATGCVSALLVLSMIGFIFFEAVTDGHKPPDLGIVITSRNPVAGGYRVTFDIANRSTATAAGVVVRGEILNGGNPLETTDVTFDYVPAESKSTGVILFSQDPGDRGIRIRATAYTDP